MPQGQGLAIDYRAGGDRGAGAASAFDLVTSLEVIEHVADPAGFVARARDAAWRPAGC